MIEDVPCKKRGTPSQKRGISTDKVYLITGIERDGDCFMRALNMGRPSIEDIKDYGQHIVQKTYLWADGLQSYSVLSTEKQCTIKLMKDRKQYDAVNHLNYVNSLHSRIKAQYKRYRSVASKYINRYAALFRIQELYRKINGQEMITSLLMKLRHLHTTFFSRQIRNESIFNVTF